MNPGYLGNLMSLSDNERIKLLDGRWIDLDEDGSRLYSRAAVEDLFTNDFVQGTGVRYITADIALEGSDKFIIAIWDAWVLKEMRTFDKSIGDQVVEEIRKAANQWSVPVRNIAFDSAGVGGFLKGWFRTAFPFVGSSAPIQEQRTLKIHGKNQDRPQYFNLRSQMFFLLREKIENCEIFLQGIPNGIAAEIKKELREIRKMEVNSDQKLRIIPKDEIKKKLGHSPDYADVISMRCVFDLKKVIVARPGRPVY
jgi:hypothetical protein